MPIFALIAFVILAPALAFAGDDTTVLEEMSSSNEVRVGGSGAPVAMAFRRRRGRPRKFEAPSRAVTLTLPEAVLASLEAIHPDPSRAIVELMRRRAPKETRPPAELAVYGRRAVITISPTRSIERRAGIQLVPLPDGRALISFDQPKTIADLELVMNDALADPTLPPNDRSVFQGIVEILREARRSADVSLVRRNIIVLEYSNGSRRTIAAPGARRRAGREA